MSQPRKDIVMSAFKKMDRTGDGVITVADLKGYYAIAYLGLVYCVAIYTSTEVHFKFALYSVYNVKNHKKYQNGQWTEKQCLEEFLKSFEAPESIDGKVILSYF